jgi:hypothetical protein
LPETLAVWHDRRRMIPRPSSAEEHPLAGHIERMTEELQAIGDILEDIRTNIAWGLQNGRVIVSLAELEQLQHAADATLGSDAFELTIRLHTALATFGADLANAFDVRSHDEPKPLRHAPADVETGDPEFVSTVTLYEVGDAVEFEWEGEEMFGEIVTLDDARNQAVVMLIPSQDEVTVCQDELKKVEPDELAYGPPPVRRASEEFQESFAGTPTSPARPILQSPRLEPHRSPDRQQSLF